MPEIGEVARVVHYLRKHLVGRTIAKCTAEEDTIVYGKVGTSAAAFQKALTGKKVLAAKQQGKYFWLELSSPPHPLMHLGMTGWIKFSNDHYSSYRAERKPEDTVWPPRFVKFMLEVKGEPAGEVAFVDARRLARIRLIDVPAEEMRNTTPLKENGPDPVVDKDKVTVEWLAEKMEKRRVPVKALLLDQAFLSGVGNWVADEVLYQAKLHPEQYSNTFSAQQVKQLHDSLIFVCTWACENLADYNLIPDEWLMKHRWGKGKKDGGKLPNGDKIVHLTVGGRTSAVVPSVQKKTAAVAGDHIEEADEDDESSSEEVKSEPEMTEIKPKSRKRKAAAEPGTKAKPSKAAKTETKTPAKKGGKKAVKSEEGDPTPTPKSKAKGKKKTSSPKGPVAEDMATDLPGELPEEELEPAKSKTKSSRKKSTGKTTPAKTKPKATTPAKTKKTPEKPKASEIADDLHPGRRRSARHG